MIQVSTFYNKNSSVLNTMRAHCMAHFAKIRDVCYSLRSLKEDILDNMMITKILLTLPPSLIISEPFHTEDTGIV